jgi:hypothetical protein
MVTYNYFFVTDNFFVVCGWEIEMESEDIWRVSYVSHADPKGHLPSWVVNALCLNSMNKIVNLKLLIESSEL